MKLTAESLIRTDLETVWRYSQTPELHQRWDLRFTDIRYLPKGGVEEPQRFRYATRIGLGLTIEGWGETIGRSKEGVSALRFGSDDPKSLIKEGAGSWSYRQTDERVCFSTVYDYSPRFGTLGRVLDLAFRPIMIWATRWSFDRLKIWIEQGTPPEVSFRMWLAKLAAHCALGTVWFYEGLVPKILAPRGEEIALVSQSGLYWGNPSAALATLGVCEMIFGLWLLWGRAEKTASALSAVGILALTTLLGGLRPDAWLDPLGGLSKNLGLVACSLVMWLCADSSPRAARGRPGLNGGLA